MDKPLPPLSLPLHIRTHTHTSVCINIISREISDGRRVSYPVPLISPRTRNISVQEPTPFFFVLDGPADRFSYIYIYSLLTYGFLRCTVR